MSEYVIRSVEEMAKRLLKLQVVRIQRIIKSSLYKWGCLLMSGTGRIIPLVRSSGTLIDKTTQRRARLELQWWCRVVPRYRERVFSRL